MPAYALWTKSLSVSNLVLLLRCIQWEVHTWIRMAPMIWTQVIECGVTVFMLWFKGSRRGDGPPPPKSSFWDFPEPGNFPGWGSLLVTQELSSFFECHGHYLSWERNILSQQCSRIACEMIAPGITNTITLHHLNTRETLTHRILYPSGGHLCQPKRRSEGLYPSSHHNKHKNSCLP